MLTTKKARHPGILLQLLLISIPLFAALPSIAQVDSPTIVVAADNSQAQDPLETMTIKINDVELVAEIADQTRERFRGLSFRTTLASNAGMLFVYPSEKELLFTMRNTSIPLSIAFVSADLKILEILTMTPFQDGPYPSTKPARFALEVNSGWFARHGISPGDHIELERAL